MELYRELLTGILACGDNHIVCARLPMEADRLVEMRSYQALKKIKAIIEDDSLEDETCFMKIEEIVCVLEELGSGGGSRHDFGRAQEQPTKKTSLKRLAFLRIYNGPPQAT